MNLSYAQHLEDYHLAQAFSGQPVGFYIDIGAGHPVADNVTCWFYLQGWHGLVVEPQADLLEKYRHIRPRDIREGRLIGRTTGPVDFHVVERLHGFSTVKAEHARAAAVTGAGYSTKPHQMTTLAALCAEHRIGRIDFLKVDVEGAEGDVLAGNDFARFRPRVICLEAVVPGSMAQGWHEWEPSLLAQGYEFVLYDKLNRFYVAREERDLLARFPREPAPWLVVPHLSHTNRAERRDDHPDHAFARRLTDDFLAQLPQMSRMELKALVRRQFSENEIAARFDEAAKAQATDRLFPTPAFADERRGAMELEAGSLDEWLQLVMESDAFTLLLGRIAASYDGGQILP